MKSPIVFFIFNRPDTATEVFQAIRKWKPAKLYVFADGPRNEKELQDCIESRAVVQIDWPCEVIRKFSDNNLGCRKAISSGLDYVFEREERAIILEDDCLPDQSFFPYCEELLEKYKDDTRIGSIAGTNTHFGIKRTKDDYFFSRYYQIWGWATWKRTWKLYDVDIKIWPYIRDNKILNNVFDSTKQTNFWEHIFQASYDGKADTWDYQLFLSLIIQNMLTIHPEKNLVSNIGFDDRATHVSMDDMESRIKTEAISFPLKHPRIVVRHKEADYYQELTTFSSPYYRFNFMRTPSFDYVRTVVKKILPESFYKSLKKAFYSGLKKLTLAVLKK